ncbi:MAG: hypothetical protein KVP17_004663 [Porospora cf. gigantea B]|uniref:uncharacterized protein n=1 Tax=Porospora cf. gigantea B TaxID=2853592 RepID=UPI00357189FD|nr:MAG: hypothetical protein KVP17_004663 [Porospora cf. gigantea B]
MCAMEPPLSKSTDVLPMTDEDVLKLVEIKGAQVLRTPEGTAVVVETGFFTAVCQEEGNVTVEGHFVENAHSPVAQYHEDLDEEPLEPGLDEEPLDEEDVEAELGEENV